MVHYFKTTGIYATSDILKVEVIYNQGVGYEARVTPCSLHNGMISMVYDVEYYTYYQTLLHTLVPCGRRGAKKEQEAYSIMKDKMNWLLEQYIVSAEKRGGRHIEIIGEVEE